MVEVIDLPGIDNLSGNSEGERTACDFLANTPVDLIVVLVNAVQLDRQLSLVLQVVELRLPTVLLLNMSDEAQRLGIGIDCEVIQENLGFSLQKVSAKVGRGIPRSLETITKRLRASKTYDNSVGAINRNLELEISMEQLIKDAVHRPLVLHDKLTHRIDQILLHILLGFLFYCHHVCSIRGGLHPRKSAAG